MSSRFAIHEFHARTRDARRVLVVDQGFLGDSIHLLPSLWEIRANYPNAALHVVSTPVACEVLAMAECANRLWPLELMPDKRSVWDHLRLLRTLRRERFDVAINLNASDRSIFFMGLCGARSRLGLRGGRWHFWNAWCIPHWLPEPDADLPISEHHRQALAAAGFSLGVPRFEIRVPASAQEWAKSVVPTGAIHVSLNSANPLKEWPVRQYVKWVGLVLSERADAAFVLSATKSAREQGRLNDFFAAVKDHRVQRLPPGLSIAQLAAVLRRSRLHIGPDSGVIHLAMALGVPTIALFRQRGGYRNWLPVGDAHRHVLAPCTCEDDRGSRCERLGEAECLAGIEPQRVADLLFGRS